MGFEDGIGADDIHAQCEHEIHAMQDVLTRNGFVRCDIMACNCGSWHPRYGLPERWEEVKYMLMEAGYPLCNENGHLVSVALGQLIADFNRHKNRGIS